MSTHSRQTISSILALVSILALFLLLIFVWTAVQNGSFYENGQNVNDASQRSYRFPSIILSETSTTTTVTPAGPDATTETNRNRNHSLHHHGHHLHHSHHRHHMSGKCQVPFLHLFSRTTMFGIENQPKCSLFAEFQIWKESVVCETYVLFSG